MKILSLRNGGDLVNNESAYILYIVIIIIHLWIKYCKFTIVWENFIFANLTIC